MQRAILLAALLLAAPALADEQPVELKPGAGVDAVNVNCGGCHSLDYVRMNSPFLTADAWKAEIGKMRGSFGAPISDEDARTILAYLSTAYGPAK